MAKKEIDYFFGSAGSSRSDYQAKWYEDNRAVHLARAKLRYRERNEELKKEAREKYKPKHRRQERYR